MRSGGEWWGRLTTDLGRLTSTRGGSREARLIAVAQLAPAPVQVLLVFVTAAALPPEARGSAVFVVTTGTFAASVLFCSFHVGAVAALKSDDRAGFRRVNTAVATIVAAVGGGAVLVAVYRPVGVGLYDAANLMLILLGLAGYVPFLYCSRVLQGLGHAAAFRTLNLLLVGLYAVTAVLLLLVVGVDDPAAVTIPWISAVAVAAAAALVLLVRTVHADGHVRTPGRGPVAGLRLSLVSHYGSMTQQLANRADVLLLGAVATAAAIGVYTFAVSLAQLVWVLAEIVALVVFSDDDVRERDDWVDLVRQRVAATLRLASAASVAVVAVGGVVMLWMLPDYADGFTILLIVLPGMIVSAEARIVLAALSARGEQALLGKTATATLLLCLIYVPGTVIFGLVGAAAASTLVYVGQFVLLRSMLARVRASDRGAS